MISIISLVTLVSFIISILVGIILIPILKRKNDYQRLSIYLEETHRDKKNTPTMGGLIFILSTLITIILLVILNKIEITYNFIIIIFVFLSYGLIGLIDDYLIIKRNDNTGLKEKQKFILQVIISILFFYLFLKADNEPLLWIHLLHLKLNIGWLYGLFILFILLASTNSVNLTDGLDGLATGLSIISLFAFGLIMINTGWLEGYKEITIFIFILIGSLLGFLIFNTNPAKIFMGDTGSLSLGGVLGSISILSRHEILLILIGIVFVIETISVILQRIYFKRTRKRLFLMTPIHHTFEKLGYKETDIVKLFWIVGFIFSLISIMIGRII